MNTIKFKKLSTVLLDHVPHGDGFLYLRMVGPETVVNAIWARLSAKDSRGGSYSSGVKILGGERDVGVSAQKGVRYRTIRVKLPGSMVDMAMIHPKLTVAEDSDKGFYLLSYEDGLPPGFFQRLNRSLSVPLLPEWESWLWAEGQELQSFQFLKKSFAWDSGKKVETDELIAVDKTPIVVVLSLGEIKCYEVRCTGVYRSAWLEVIRDQLMLGVPLKSMGDRRYVGEGWSVYYEDARWQVTRGDELLLTGSSLDLALVLAREKLGVPLVIGG